MHYEWVKLILCIGYSGTGSINEVKTGQCKTTGYLVATGVHRLVDLFTYCPGDPDISIRTTCMAVSM